MARWVGHQPPWGRWRARADRGPVARLLLWPLLAVLTVWERLWYTERPPFPRPNIADHETLDPQWKLLDSNWRYVAWLGGMRERMTRAAATTHALPPSCSICSFLSRAFFVFGPPGAWPRTALLCCIHACRRRGCRGEAHARSGCPSSSTPGCAAHILKNIWQPVVFLAVVAGVCERWGFHSEKPLSGMAAQTFSMCSFVLSLVLSVRLRVAFDKW